MEKGPLLARRPGRDRTGEKGSEGVEEDGLDTLWRRTQEGPRRMGEGPAVATRGSGTGVKEGGGRSLEGVLAR